MLIYCCIDGTDSYDPTDGPGVMPIPATGDAPDTGHVRRLGSRHFAAPGFRYFRGSTDPIFGATSALIVEQALGWIRTVYGSAQDSTRLLCLGGFSRGGAMALVVAHRLQAEGIPVQELYLFDAVDRSAFMQEAQTATIPSNVARAFHALRDPKARSRRGFTNCGLRGSGGNLETKAFLTTHGGVGGRPNGVEMVQPGLPGADLSEAERTEAARGTGPESIDDPRQSLIHEFGEAHPTTITPDQELSGMREVWTWMSGKALSTLRAG